MHLERLPSGSWRVTVHWNGERRRATARTEQGARLRGAELMVELGARRLPAGVTVADAIDARLADDDRLTKRSLSDYLALDRKLRSTDTPLLARPIEDVEPVDFDDLYRTLARRDDWSAHRIDKLHDLLGSSFARAVRRGLLRHNPTRGVAPPKPDLSDINVPTDKQVRLILAKASGPLRLALRIAATVGARRGEIVALQWGDVDFDRHTLHIQRGITYTPEDGLIVGDTKTKAKGRRTLSVRPNLLSELRAHKLAGAPSSWLFTHDGATPWRPDYLTHSFEKLTPGCRLHDLRHYVATTLLMGGTSVEIVAGILGHASAETTRRIYAHWIPGADAAAADVMDVRLGAL